MTSATEKILERLEEVKFETRLGGAMPFGEELPLVSGVAWETQTAQLALIAECKGSIEETLWRQLLFAGSGIRHHLSGNAPSAFGTPLVLAVVDGDSEAQMRGLAESLARDYAVFNRVDLNLVPEKVLEDREKLDDALAPLMPRCRSILGKEIAREEVKGFWSELRGEVEEAAANLDDAFASIKVAAGRDGAEQLIGEGGEGEELPSPAPVGKIDLENFRSIKEMHLELADVNILHGPNGGGKTSVVEAMELGWAGTSQRRPDDDDDEVDAAEYEEHVRRNGEGEFSVALDGKPVSKIAKQAEAELGRCVLTHEAMTTLISERPQLRFEALLRITGLQIPDLDGRTRALVARAKGEADAALGEVGIAPLPRSDTNGLEYLRNKLRSDFLGEFSKLAELGVLEKTLATVSGGAYAPRKWPAEDRLRKQLERADGVVADAAEDQASAEEVVSALEQAASDVEELLSSRLEAAGAAQRLLEAIQHGGEPAEEAPVQEELDTEEQAEPIGVELAARWLNHARGLSAAAERFREDAGEIEDAKWSARMVDYAEAVDRASGFAPDAELERLGKPRPSAKRAEPEVEEEVFSAAGFARVPASSAELVDPLRELAEVLQGHADGLRAIARGLHAHPARRIGEERERVMDALCRFELARVLRRGGPIVQTSERIVAELLDERLAPVVRELVGAIVRFEWYFKPLQMSSENKKLIFGGLATERADLDARLVLNSAEKTVLGVAWFLALHMLQPKERRRVLVLDDPTSGFDAANQAGFANTLRAFVRLLKPEQVVVTTHDDAVAAVLAGELAAVDGWPGSLARLRFQRGGGECSEYTVEERSEESSATSSESVELGLLEDVAAS
jgi:hypothetical protein